MTNAELAILSLVVERPRYGYEIEQVIEQRGMREWTEVGFSSIYYLLKKLEQDGLVEGRVEQQARRGLARKVYTATPAGFAAWRAGILDTLSVPRHSYPPIQLGLSCLPGIARAEALEALRRYRASLQERLDTMLAGAEAQRPMPDHVEEMFRYSEALMRAELAWLDGFIARLETQPPPAGQESELET